MELQKEKPVILHQNYGPDVKVELKLAEWKLIRYLRDLGWGGLEVTIQNSTPIVIKESYKTVKLV